METVNKTITYKREEISEGLAILIELKNNLGYSVKELTNAIGYRGDVVYKALKREYPVCYEMYIRAKGLLELSKSQAIKGREMEIISRINLLERIGKKVSYEKLSEMLGEDKKYISNYISSGKLIGDELYKKLLETYEDILEAEELIREQKRLAKTFKISDVIDELIEEINRLELNEDKIDINEIDDYYSKLNCKKRLIKKLKQLENNGIEEVTKHGLGYVAIR